MSRRTRSKGHELTNILRTDDFQAYLMLIPWTVGFAAFTIFPIVWVLRYSFFSFDGYASRYVGLYNFIRLFLRDPDYWLSVVNTFIVGFGKLLIELPLAFVVALFLNRRMAGQSAFRTVFFMPNIISVAIVGLIFFFIFAAYQGIANNVLQELGIIKDPVNWFGNKWTSILVIGITSIWQNFGINMIFFLTGLQSIAREMYEAAGIEGASRMQQTRYVTIPMMAPMIQIIILNAVLGSLKMTDLVLVLTNGQPAGQSEVMMTFIFKKFFLIAEGVTGSVQIGYASSLGVISSIILGIVTILYLRVTRRMRSVY
jgi:raffinose/stachyose/melibiose transport system permease protein